MVNHNIDLINCKTLFKPSPISKTEQLLSKSTSIGFLKSKGTANGKEVYEGPNGGRFYINANGNRISVQSEAKIARHQ